MVAGSSWEAMLAIAASTDAASGGGVSVCTWLAKRSLTTARLVYGISRLNSTSDRAAGTASTTHTGGRPCIPSAVARWTKAAKARATVRRPRRELRDEAYDTRPARAPTRGLAGPQCVTPLNARRQRVARSLTAAMVADPWPRLGRVRRVQ